MEFVYATGGREKYYKTDNVRDCVVRAICNATGKDYKEVYDAINQLAKRERRSSRKAARSSSRNGVYKNTFKKYIEQVLGYKFTALMGIGTGCTTHLCKEELPNEGSYILNLSGHLSCWKDGKLYDTYDCSRGGRRCVYGYWKVA